MRLALSDAIDFGRRLLRAQQVPDDIALDVAEHLAESDRVGYTCLLYTSDAADE